MGSIPVQAWFFFPQLLKLSTYYDDLHLLKMHFPQYKYMSFIYSYHTNSNKLKRKKWNWLTISDNIDCSTHANFVFVTRAVRSENNFTDVQWVYLKRSCWNNFGWTRIFFLKLTKCNLGRCRHVFLLFKSFAWLVCMKRDASHQTSDARKTGTIHLKR